MRRSSRLLLVALLEAGTAEVALVLVERVLLAVGTALLLELWLAKPAAVFVATVLRTPQATRFALGRLTDEARLASSSVTMPGIWAAT